MREVMGWSDGQGSVMWCPRGCRELRKRWASHKKLKCVKPEKIVDLLDIVGQ